MKVMSKKPDGGDCALPFQYIEGPDYCEVLTATGARFALTVQPELMRALERALENEMATLKYPPRDQGAIEHDRSDDGWRPGAPGFPTVCDDERDRDSRERYNFDKACEAVGAAMIDDVGGGA